MNKTIIVVGIPGAGKSSIIQETIRQLSSVLVINYGDKMLEEATLEGITRDELRKMPLKDQQKIGIEAAKKIQKSQNKETILIDTHALIRTEIGYCPGLPLEVLKILSPRALAWVECSPSLILQRRTKDVSRARDKESAQELTMHQELTRAFLASCSMFTGALLCRISNDEGTISGNAAPLIHLIEKLNKS